MLQINVNGSGCGGPPERESSETVPRSLLQRTVAKAPGLRRLPVAKLLAVGEIAMLAREHFERLDADERREFLSLMARARGRRSNLSPDDRAHFAALIAKLNPRLFAGLVADKLSPVPLPKRVVRGSRRRDR
jgi:hypothetical protein